jgi:hypothetical protein
MFLDISHHASYRTYGVTARSRSDLDHPSNEQNTCRPSTPIQLTPYPSQLPPDRLLVGVIEPDETSSVLVSDKREGVIANF